jgi:hypothetical protein
MAITSLDARTAPPAIGAGAGGGDPNGIDSTSMSSTQCRENRRCVEYV